MRENPHPGPTGSQAPKGSSAPAGSCPANTAGHSFPAGAAEPEDSDGGIRDLDGSPTETHKQRESLSGSILGQVVRGPGCGTAAQIRGERIPETTAALPLRTPPVQAHDACTGSALRDGAHHFDATYEELMSVTVTRLADRYPPAPQS
jgi:hypothetical protein